MQVATAATSKDTWHVDIMFAVPTLTAAVLEMPADTESVNWDKKTNERMTCASALTNGKPLCQAVQSCSNNIQLIQR